jgi:hypothetical protein
MRTGTCLAAGLLALAGLTGEASAGGGKGDAAELAALTKEYEAARTAYWQQKPPDPAKNPTKEFQPKFLDLAKRAKGSDAGVKAASQVLSIADTTPESKKAVEEAVALALGPGLDQPSLAAFAWQLRIRGNWILGEEKAVEALRTMAEKAKAPDARAAALLQNAALWIDNDGAPPEKKVAARALLDRVLKDYANSGSASEAANYVFVLEHLQVGMVAPDIEGTDVEGKKFRLSEYRGKVVLLDFWGFW